MRREGTEWGERMKRRRIAHGYRRQSLLQAVGECIVHVALWGLVEGVPPAGELLHVGRAAAVDVGSGGRRDVTCTPNLSQLWHL